jgi:hypothetical protein
VCALLNYPPSINHEDFISIADSAQPVSYDYGGLSFGGLEFIDALLHDSLTRCIKSRSSFIQQEYRGLLDEGSRDGNPLQNSAVKRRGEENRTKWIADLESRSIRISFVTQRIF